MKLDLGNCIPKKYSKGNKLDFITYNCYYIIIFYKHFHDKKST